MLRMSMRPHRVTTAVIAILETTFPVAEYVTQNTIWTDAPMINPATTIHAFYQIWETI